jgi:hypothetical protein
MCAVSMIMDHFHDKWQQQRPQVFPYPLPAPPQPGITVAEIEEFHQLLERARKYDREHNQPDCELEEKKQRLLKLAEKLGVKIDFV